MKKYYGNTVEYWKQNAEEAYLTTPISVLKYITVLEEQAEQLRKHAVSGSLQLTDEQKKVLADLGSRFVYEGVKDDLRISEFGILEIFNKWKELLSN